ncbi:uncharacterized protein LOC126837496 [Adelges cooleyi]|uniref:uncharacterized protein LOC126837496 n=1 Tax=Adelges cooleyi TaxID=133065 RepID=UPI00217F6FE1|nr:uncharacterized protein LOC126837496 [Adelges cooleyi]
MLSRKEELFVKPFQQRLYHQHKSKLKSATARVDNTPPQEWSHIVRKKKKFQKEKERCTQILINNSILWQHLNNIMSTSRVDNRWDGEQPKYCHRVKLFINRSDKLTVRVEDQTSADAFPLEGKKKKCSACNPYFLPCKTEVPEERIPWEPAKKKLSKKLQSLSIQNEPATANKQNVLSDLPKPKTKRAVDTKLQQDRRINYVKNNLTVETDNYVNYIEIEEGTLDVVIKYPSSSKVTVNDGIKKRILPPNDTNNSCQCKRC